MKGLDCAKDGIAANRLKMELLRRSSRWNCHAYMERDENGVEWVLNGMGTEWDLQTLEKPGGIGEARIWRRLEL